jgi:signal transduction histidine kinase
MLGKAMNVTSLAVALVAVGTLLTLLLVIFNRRVTLRQINASLAQISNQIKELQDGKSSGAKQ